MMNEILKVTTKINEEFVGKKVKIYGWVNKIRKLSDLIFIDLRDIDGIVQLIINFKNANFETANSLGNEFVICVEGIVILRKTPNLNIFSGKIELQVEDLKIINEAERTPFIIANETDGLENIRNEYRYLDVRRPIVTQNLIFRSNLNKIIRDFFYNQNFKEIETPIITKKTIGGAGEFELKSKRWDKLFYSLAQSPQMYKQLLMYGGIDKYFQIARCFRDEPSRSDRQLEFTQLDIELLWVDENDIQKLIESLFSKIFKDLFEIKLSVPFKKISYDDALNKYGSDKPDLRFKNEIINEDFFSQTKNKALMFELSNNCNEIKNCVEYFISENIKSGIKYLVFENSKLFATNLKSQDDEILKNILNTFKLQNFIYIFSSEINFEILNLLGKLRLILGQKLNLINSNEFNFSWVVQWPLFELSEDNKIVSPHHPFTDFEGDKEILKKLNHQTLLPIEIVKLNFKSRSYDLVLNGQEIGGGSIRINDAELQKNIFEILKFSEIEIQKNFEWFLKAMKFGIPIHGGIALGIDRILQILLKQNSIRDVIAFPKSTSGNDDMTKSPNE